MLQGMSQKLGFNTAERNVAAMGRSANAKSVFIFGEQGGVLV